MIWKNKLRKSSWKIIGGEDSGSGVSYYWNDKPIEEYEFNQEKKRICLYQKHSTDYDYGPMHDPEGGVFNGVDEIITQYLPTKWYTKA
jgi:hypothetical protein